MYRGALNAGSPPAPLPLFLLASPGLPAPKLKDGESAMARDYNKCARLPMDSVMCLMHEGRSSSN
jgi:hypothetical protein